MKKIIIPSIIGFSCLANAATFTTAKFGNWVQSGAVRTGDVFLADNTLVGTATLEYSDLVGFDAPVGTGVAAVFATAVETQAGNPPSSLTWTFSIAPLAGFQVDGISFFTLGSDIANPTISAITGAGTVTLAEGPEDFFSDGVDGQVNPTTLTANPGTALNGWAAGTHENWSLDVVAGNSLSFNYSADTAVAGINNEALRFDAQISQIPEPSSAALLGLGALGFLARRKRA